MSLYQFLDKALTRLMRAIITIPIFYNLNIGKKLALGYGSLVLFTIFVIGVSLWGGYNTKNSIDVTGEVRAPAALTAAEAEANLLRMLADVRDYLTLGETDIQPMYDQHRHAFEENLKALDQLSDNFSESDRAGLQELKIIFEEWSPLPKRMFHLRDNQLNREPAYRLLALDGVLLEKRVVFEITRMINDQIEREGTKENLQLLGDMAYFHTSFDGMFASLRSYATTRDLVFKQEYYNHLEANEVAWNALLAKREQLTRNQPQRLENIVTYRAEFLDLPNQIFQLVESDRWREDLYIFRTEALPRATQMQALLHEITKNQQRALQQDLNAGRKQLFAVTQNTLIVGVITIILAAFLAFISYWNITIPIKQLTEAAKRVSAGDLTMATVIETRDEIGDLAQSLNHMAQRLQDAIDNLEDRVEERTKALITSAEISRQLTAIRDFDELLQSVVDLIRTEFKVYHAHIYLVEDTTGDLVMAKGSGKVGKQLETEGHRLEEGQGIVGTVAYLNEHFISNNVDEVLNFVHNPLLPHTQAELALPLRLGNKVLGVLDIQSDEKDRFSADDISLMQSIADQIAVAVDNARVYDDLENALIHQYDITLSYSRFVPREFLHFLGKRDITEVRLGDQIQQMMAVLFCDIRSFTTLSEQMTPQENFNFINAYLNRVSPIIRTENGFIDKYIGDAVMALFPKSAEDAVRAAIAIQKEVADYNKTRIATGKQPIKIGIGLHTGKVMLGTVGEEQRMEGTVISDAVNLASRMEGLTKTYNASIVMSEYILYALDQNIKNQRSSQFTIRFLDRVTVKGKKEPVSVFEILDGEKEERIAMKLKTRPEFEMGLFHYQYKEFTDAKQYFEEVLELDPADDAARLYLHRINSFIEYGVPLDWEGVTSFKDI